MIKINLLGEQDAGSADSMMWLAAYCASVVGLILVCIGLYTYINYSISDVNDRVEVAEGQLAKLREKTKEVVDLERRKTELQNMTVAIAGLKKSQEGPVKLLDDLNLAMPERLWFTTASLKSNLMHLEGIALTDESIVEFVQKLRESPYFDNVKLVDRLTSTLAQVNTYNTSDGSQAKIICRAEKVQVDLKLLEIRDYAEKRGLQYVNAIPNGNLGNGAGQLRDASGGQTVTKLSFENDPTHRLTGGRPSFYAWENVQKVEGEVFIIEAKMSYTPKNLNLDALQQVAPAEPTPVKGDTKAK